MATDNNDDDKDRDRDKDHDDEPWSDSAKLEQRFIDFAIRIIKLTARLPKTPAGKHVAGQIMRSGTSPAPNYGEARGAESRADFVHKLRVVLKELNETSVWLRIIKGSELLRAAVLRDIMERTVSCVESLPLQLRPLAPGINDRF